MRQKWAEAWAQWLTPGGELVTLMFPVEAEGRQGPPWPVPLQLYEDTLRPAGPEHPFFPLQVTVIINWLSSLGTSSVSCSSHEVVKPLSQYAVGTMLPEKVRDVRVPGKCQSRSFVPKMLHMLGGACSI